jgi:hypothetical protein
VAGVVTWRILQPCVICRAKLFGSFVSIEQLVTHQKGIEWLTSPAVLPIVRRQDPRRSSCRLSDGDWHELCHVGTLLSHPCIAQHMQVASRALRSSPFVRLLCDGHDTRKDAFSTSLGMCWSTVIRTYSRCMIVNPLYSRMRGRSPEVMLIRVAYLLVSRASR